MQTPSPVLHSPDALRSRLGRLRLCIRLAMLAGGVGGLLLRLTAVAFAGFVADRFLRLPPGTRAAVLTAECGALGWWVVRLLALPAVRPLPDRALAYLLEERLPATSDLLASALAFHRGGAAGAASADLQAGVLRRAEAVAATLDPLRFVRWRGPLRRLGAGLAAVALLAVPAAVWPRTAGLWYRRNVRLERVGWPQRTHLALVDFPGPVRFVPVGSDVQIRVRAAGELPDSAVLLLTGREDGDTRKVRMQLREQGVFSAAVEDLRAGLDFAVAAGDARLRTRRLQAVRRPAVAEARLLVDPPDYVAPEPFEAAWEAPSFEVPAGSRATVVLRATKPLSRATCRPDDGPAEDLPLPEPTEARYGFRVDRDRTLSFSLTDRFGIETARPLAVRVRALPDRAPEVRLAGRGLGDAVVPNARLPLRVRVEDDYGLTAAGLSLRHRTGEQTVELSTLELGDEAAGRRLAAEPTLDLGRFDLPAAGRLLITAHARDNHAPDEPNRAESEPLAFRLVTVAELLDGLLVLQRDLRRDLEGRILAQENLLARLEGAAAPPAEAGRRQRSVAQVLGLTASGYESVLRQMRNNRVLGPAGYQRRSAGIVRPLRRLVRPTGAAQRAASLLDRGSAPEAREAMRRALERMRRVRSEMSLLEGYAGVVASVRRVTETQRQVLDSARELEGDLLEFLEE
ncbi:MAG: hypothetical protein ACOC7T_00855 [Planctomycetota bacterium]